RHHYYDMGDEPWRMAGWIQAGYNFAGPDLDAQVDWGQFADGDVGVKLSAVRHWDDTSLGFWWSKTDVHAPNKDFTKAGVRLELPAEKWFGSWFGRASGHIWEQDVPLLSNWTLDSGRDEGKVMTPEMMLGQLRPMALKRNVSRILKEYCSYESGQEKEPEVALSLLEQVFPSMRTSKAEM
ncbi:MAG: YjbH domain-containing protein, partial [Fretibacterium sp.]|nr:YjbH domain-containing protein [Fretibacterium sp.]